MTIRFVPKSFVAALTALSLVLGVGGAATVALAPDAAFAKSDKSNGKSKGHDKGAGKSKGRDKAKRGNSGKAKSNRSKGSQVFKSAKGKWKINGNTSARGNAKQAGKSRAEGPRTLAGLGRQFERDVNALFGRERTTERVRRQAGPVQKRKTSAPKRSLRPAAKPLGTASLMPGEDWHRPKRRDPLVAAITDPNGSDKLRNLNASNAAAPAFANASPNSNVGKIATYQDAAEEYYGLRDDLIGARRDLRELDESYDGRTSEEIMEEIEALDPDDPDFEMKLEDLGEELADAEAFEAARYALQEGVRDLRRESLIAAKEAAAAFYDASKGSTLTKAALADFHGNLGLPTPVR